MFEQFIKNEEIVTIEIPTQFKTEIHTGILKYHEDNKNLFLQCDGYTICSITEKFIETHIIKK
jgi:hypothetical protein